MKTIPQPTDRCDLAEPSDISSHIPDEILSDFRNFMYVVWTQAFHLPPPSPLQYSIGYALQYRYQMDNDGIIRRQIQALRGAGKTYILAAFAMWLLLRNPERKIMYIAVNQNKAKDVVRLCRRIMELPICSHLEPKGLKGLRDGAQHFDVGCCPPAKDASMTAMSITGAITGYHPDDIISDDIETWENAITQAGRDKLRRVVAEFESMVNPGGSVTILGTPHTVQSIYIDTAEGYNLRIWPAEYPNPDDDAACFRVAEDVIETVKNQIDLIGQATYPERFDNVALEQKRAQYGDHTYYLQMLCRVDLADKDRYPLKLRNLIVYDCDYSTGPSLIAWGTSKPVTTIRSEGINDDKLHWAENISETMLKYEQSILVIDPSGGGDKVGYAVIKALQGTLYVLEAGGLQGGHSDATLTALAYKAQEYRVNEVVVETNFGDGLYEKALEPILRRITGGVTVTSVRNTKQKERRICDVLEPVTSSHRLVIDTKVAKNSTLMSQFCHITRDKGSLPAGDDEIDALAIGVAHLMDVIGVDAQSAEAHRTEQARLEELREMARSQGDVFTPARDQRQARRRSQAGCRGFSGRRGSSRFHSRYR